MIDQLFREFRIFPAVRFWLVTFGGTFLLLAAAFLALPDFSDLSSVPSFRNILLVAFIGFFTPALFEELVFRFWLNRRQTAISIILSTVAFVLWHPLEAHLFLHEARDSFMDAGFLCFVGVFGLFSCFLRKWSGSLWPSVISHWIIVVTWKVLGGAQFLT